MKPAGIGLILLLLVAMGSVFHGEAEARGKLEVKKTAALSEPRKLVWDYYTDVLAYQYYQANKGDKKVKPVPNKTLDLGFVTRHFVDSFKKLKQEAGFLDYDPIVCGTDSPDNMTGTAVNLVRNTGTEATVKVGWAGFTPPATPFTVKLKKQSQGWRIDAVVCNGDDFDSMYQRIKKVSKKGKAKSSEKWK